MSMRTFPKNAVLLILCGCLALMGAPPAAGQEKTMTPLSSGIPMIEGIKMLDAGAVAPDFSVKDTEGASYNLADEKGKRPVLLVFWSIFCEPCRIEMPIVQKLHEKYGGSGLSVVAVALDGEPLRNSIVGFVKQEGYTFRILIDELDAKEMFKIADPYGVAGTPTLYLVDKTGRIALVKAGRIKEDDLEKAVQSVLKK